MINNIPPSLDYIKLVVETLDTKLNEPTNQKTIKVLNVVNPTNKETLSWNFRD